MAAKSNLPAKRATESKNLPMPEKPAGAVAHRDRIPNGDWVGARLIDVQDKPTNAGALGAEYTFEVTSPRIYEGTRLYLHLHEGLEKTLDDTNPGSLAAAFPGIDLLNADKAWAGMRGVPMRVHVGHRAVTDVETGETKVAYRVSGFRPDERARVG